MTYDAIILNAQVHDVCDLVGFCSDIHQHHRQHQDNLHVHHNQVRSCDELIDQQVVTISIKMADVQGGNSMIEQIFTG